MVNAVKLCNWWHVPCFAHTLNLIVQASLNEITEVRGKVKAIVEVFKKSPQAFQKLNNVQKQMDCPVLTVKQDCPTRWNSTVDMLERILKIKEPLLRVHWLYLVQIVYYSSVTKTGTQLKNAVKFFRLLKK